MTRVETFALRKSFGGITALDDVSVEFPAASVTAVIGPNGAGKTTLFNVISGLVKPDEGEVCLIREKEPGVEECDKISGLAPHQVAGRGVGVLFQHVRIFPRLSALENVLTGIRGQLGESIISALLRPGAVAREEAEATERARKLLDEVGLAEEAYKFAEQLSFGQQKLVALARLLANDPQVLLLDEPVSGVHPTLAYRILDLIGEFAERRRRAIVMIEHNLNVVRRVGDWVYLMSEGRVEMFGKPCEVLRDDALHRTFPTLCAYESRRFATAGYARYSRLLFPQGDSQWCFPTGARW